MSSIFHSYLCKFVLGIFCDILIYSPNWTMHLEHVQKVFKILGSTTIEYLGHIITLEDVQVGSKQD